MSKNNINESQPLISVIVPVYNVQKYLLRCVNSILDQTYKNLEVILVDDGSTDKSSKLCDELARKYSFITVIHQENRGLSVARNVGILEARGEYITLLDSDDSIENDMIEHLFNLIQKYDCTLSICQHNIVFEDSGKEMKFNFKK